MPLISEINKEIAQSLSSLEDAISIIEHAKNNGIPISAKNSEFIDDLDIFHSKELIALMLESKIRKRRAKLTAAGIVDERYQPFIIASETSLNDFNSYLAGLPLEQKYYYDFIIRPIDLHSSAMQIYSDGVKARSFYVESGADLNKRYRIPINKAINAEEHNYIDGRILSADYGCTIYTIQNLNAMRRLIQSGNYLDGNHQIQNLEPVFVRNAQSMLTLQKYSENNHLSPIYVNKRKTITLAEQIENFAVTCEVVGNAGDIYTKQKNYASLYKTKKYLLSAQELLESLGNDERKLEEILFNRSVAPILNSVYDQMDLSADERESVRGLFNQDQIKLALKYQIPTSFFKDYTCFQDRDNSRFIYDFVVRFADEDPRKVASILSSVKKSSNINQSKLILEHNITPEQIHSINGLSDSELAPIIMDYIIKWKALANEKGADAACTTLRVFERSKAKTEDFNIKSFNAFDAEDFMNIAIHQQSLTLLRVWTKAGVNMDTYKYNFMESAISTNNLTVINEVILAGAKLTDSQAANLLKENYPPEKLLSAFKRAIDEENIQAFGSFLKINPQLLNSKINDLNIIEYIVVNNKPKLLKALDIARSSEIQPYSASKKRILDIELSKEQSLVHSSYRRRY